MNNRGQTIFMAILIGVIIFAFGMLAMNFIKDDITIATNSNNLDCNNVSITDGAKITCLAMDATIPYLFLLIISAAGGLIAAKLAF